MATFFVQHRVADFDTWYEGYLGAGEIQDKGGVTARSVYRDPSDPQLVLVMHRFATRAQGEAFMANPDLRAAQQAAGVDLSSVRVEFYDQV